MLLLAALSWSIAASCRPGPVFTPAEQAWIRAHPVVTFVAETGLPPLEDDEDGQYTGLFSGYVDHVSHVSGLQFRYQRSDSWDDAQDRFLRGEATLFINAPPDGLRPEVFSQVERSQPYFASPLMVIGRADGPMVFGPADMAGKVVAVRNRSLQGARMDAYYPGAIILGVDSADEGMQAVVEGRADILGGTAAMYFPRLRRRYAGTLAVAGMVGARPYEARMGVRRDEPLLLSILNKSLASMTAEQTDQLEQEWLGMTADYGEPSFRSIVHYRPVQAVITLIAAMMLAVATYWALRSRRRALKSERAKAQFLAMMSHEIRTPINAMVGAVELLQRTVLDRRQRDLTETAAASADSLVALLDNVLDLSKMDAARLSLERLPTDVHALMLGCVRQARMRAEPKGLTVDLAVTGSAHSEDLLLLDATRLRQVVDNLLSNAVKFTERGGIAVSMGLAESTGSGAGEVNLCVAVTDTGVGIAPEHHAALFQPYRQADQTTTRRYGGTGLGLAICRELVTLMGGTIGLRSAPGKGTEVTFEIPAARSTTYPNTAHAPDPTMQGTGAVNTTRGTSRVLIVEDHPANQSLIRDQLSALGVHPVLAGNGKDALAQLRVAAFDLVLMDCHMPGMDGYETTRRIRADELTYGDVPVIAISAATDANHLQRCQDSRMDGILRKPLRISDLSGVLDLWGIAHHPPGQGVNTAGPVDEPAIPCGESITAEWTALQVALREGDGVLARHWAHRIHGVALMADLPAVAAAAESIERTLLSERWPDAAATAALDQAVVALSGRFT